jgi:trigger factor
MKKKTFPERDTEFAKQLGNYESWEEFETKLRAQAADGKKAGLEDAAKDRMVGELIQRYQFEVPETVVQRQIDSRLDRLLRHYAQQGVKTEDLRRLDFNGLREANREAAINEVKASLILDRIADMENVTVSDGEVDNEVLLMSIQGREPYDSVRERLERDGGIERIREQMRREKTGNVLYEKLAS